MKLKIENKYDRKSKEGRNILKKIENVCADTNSCLESNEIDWKEENKIQMDISNLKDSLQRAVDLFVINTGTYPVFETVKNGSNIKIYIESLHLVEE